LIHKVGRRPDFESRQKGSLEIITPFHTASVRHTFRSQLKGMTPAVHATSYKATHFSLSTSATTNLKLIFLSLSHTISSANEQEKLAQFRSLTGAPEQVARLYLDASNWDIEVP